MQTLLLTIQAEERELLNFALRRAGMSVTLSGSLDEVVGLVQERPFDLLLVAWSGQRDLRKMAHTIRAVVQLPLLFIVDNLSEDLHCDLLDLGVDVVVERPFSLRVLSRQVRGLLRRTSNVPPSILPVIEINQLSVDPTVRTVQYDATPPQRLTQLEFRLLYMLMSNAGHVVTTDELVERVWGYSEAGNRGLVRGLVSRLRRKIEPEANEPLFIETLPGIGYRFILEQ
ncbi:MAG: response regulator transcription factor [Ardenticatenaceae bacterium]|nr:response regulator transcription factor [Ardenticatenaceae bacterium]